MAGIIEQIRDFFLVWKPSDIVDTTVPAGGSHVAYTNMVPSLVMPADAKYGEYFAPTRDLIHQQGGPGTDGRPRPVFLDADVAFVFVTHNDVCDRGRRQQGDDGLDQCA